MSMLSFPMEQGVKRVPNIKSAVKRMRIAEKRRVRNQAIKSAVKTAIKKALAMVGTAEKATAFRKAISTIDKAASKGVIHPNKAARLKARLSKKVLA